MDLVVTNANDADDKKNGVSKEMIVGLIVVISLLVILLLACLCYGKCKKQEEATPGQDKEHGRNSHVQCGLGFPQQP